MTILFNCLVIALMETPEFLLMSLHLMGLFMIFYMVCVVLLHETIHTYEHLLNSFPMLEELRIFWILMLVLFFDAVTSNSTT